MSFEQYQKTSISEMRPYVPGEDLAGISVNAEDVPTLGGMIARNPENHKDQWYVAKKFFEKNYRRPVLTTERELALMGAAPLAFFSEQWMDADGNPAGGVTTGMGFTISWQNGPLGRDENRKIPNGAFVENIIRAASDRLGRVRTDRLRREMLSAEAAKHGRWLVIANQVGAAVKNAQLYQAVKEHAADLEKAYERLKELDKIRDELIQNVSHEMRMPLTFMKGYVELLLNEEFGPLTPDQLKSLSVVAQKTEQLTRLVHGIVTLEVVSAKTLEAHPIDLGQLMHSELESSAPTMADSNIELVEEIAPDLPPVMADKSRIGQVVANLLSNAIKFSPGGGTITVRIRRDGGWVRTEIADTGIGIPAAKVPRIFERFYQVNGSSQRRFGGVGLGLAIVKQIIEAHGGVVGVKSTEGEGSTFFFTLPVAGL